MENLNRNRPLGITVVGVLMIVFGATEVLTGFTHDFFGVLVTQSTTATYAGAAIGALYVLAGVLVFSMKRWAAIAAIVALVADVLGRVWMVAAGLFPLTTVRQTFSIVAGTVIAIAFAIYIAIRWKAFR
jgi:hypothetical protein